MRHLETNPLHQLPRRLVRWVGILPLGLWLCVLVSGTAEAAGFRSPEACQAYTGQEHLNCLYEYIGIRDDKPGTTADRKDTAQQEMFDQIREQRDQVDRNVSGGHEPPQGFAGQTQKSSPAALAPPPSTASTAAVAPPPSATTALGFLSPYECRAYTGDAHLNCLYAYVEIQRSQAGKVEQELRAQKETIGQLRDQVDRQQRLQEQASSSPPPATYMAPPIYPGFGYLGYGGYPGFGYSAPGLSLYLGAPGFYYGRSFYGPRFFGPRFYGPRSYGPRSFGRRHR